jgi:hypothetical protein
VQWRWLELNVTTKGAHFASRQPVETDTPYRWLVQWDGVRINGRSIVLLPAERPVIGSIASGRVVFKNVHCMISTFSSTTPSRLSIQTPPPPPLTFCNHVIQNQWYQCNPSNNLIVGQQLQRDHFIDNLDIVLHRRYCRRDAGRCQDTASEANAVYSVSVSNSWN